MGQTMDHSTPAHSSEQKIPQAKPNSNSGRSTEKKAKTSDVAASRATSVNGDTRSSAAKRAAKLSSEERQRMIEEAAYYRAEQRGFDNGNEVQDWLDAESEINSKFPG